MEEEKEEERGDGSKTNEEGEKEAGEDNGRKERSR